MPRLTCGHEATHTIGAGDDDCEGSAFRPNVAVFFLLLIALGKHFEKQSFRRQRPISDEFFVLFGETVEDFFAL